MYTAVKSRRATVDPIQLRAVKRKERRHMSRLIILRSLLRVRFILCEQQAVKVK